MSRRSLTRRGLLRAAAALPLGAAAYARVLGAHSRLNVAYIGVGGIAESQHVAPLAERGAACTAYCDVDRERWGACARRFPDAKGYTDYRKLFDERAREIDAVMVGTPDHHHFPAPLLAMRLDKHVYTQKPLTHTVWEARELTKEQSRRKLATQMGNQGHASESLRLTIDYLRSGAIGDLLEAHVWTDRPWWRQGLARPEGGERVPAHLDWDAWLGPAPQRPFRHEPSDEWGGLYHPFNWRGFRDFGCGALGDMACHELDPLYWALAPGYPAKVALVDGEPCGDADMFASASIVRFTFAAAGERPGFALTWYEGGRKPERPAELGKGEELTGEGALYVGSAGKLIAMPSARAAPRLLSAERHEEYGPPEPKIERSEDGHAGEWYRACIGERPHEHPKSSFAYAGPFTETVLLGCIAQAVGGELEYDAEKMEFRGRPDATALVTKAYRAGWDFRLA